MRIAVGLGRERGEKELEASGVSRRDFMKFCTAVAVTMGFGPAFATDVAAALTGKRPSVVYLHEAECTGCSEALLRTASPFIDDLILDTISLDYHETIMAAAGEAAEGALEQAVSNPDGFIAVVEGAIPTADNGQYGYIAGHTMLETCRRILPKAKLHRKGRHISHHHYRHTLLLPFAISVNKVFEVDDILYSKDAPLFEDFYL